MRAEPDQRVLIGELAPDALKLQDGLIGLALLAITLAEAEDGSSGEFAVLVVLDDEGLIGVDSGREVVVGFFFEERLLEREAKVGGGEGSGEDAENGKQEEMTT